MAFGVFPLEIGPSTDSFEGNEVTAAASCTTYESECGLGGNLLTMIPLLVLSFVFPLSFFYLITLKIRVFPRGLNQRRRA